MEMTSRLCSVATKLYLGSFLTPLCWAWDANRGTSRRVLWRGGSFCKFTWHGSQWRVTCIQHLITDSLHLQPCNDKGFKGLRDPSAAAATDVLEPDTIPPPLDEFIAKISRWILWKCTWCGSGKRNTLEYDSGLIECLSGDDIYNIIYSKRIWAQRVTTVAL